MVWARMVVRVCLPCYWLESSSGCPSSADILLWKILIICRNELVYFKGGKASFCIKQWYILEIKCLNSPPAPCQGHFGCMEVLLTWGTDVDMDIPHLGTPLYTACVCQELECARKLLREGMLRAGETFSISRHSGMQHCCLFVFGFF